MIKLTAKETRFYPKQSTEWSAWFDVFAAEKIEVKPNEVKLIPLWIKLCMDKWDACLVMSRSSMPIKKKCLIPNWIWLIDSDYRGEVHIEVYNFSNELIIFEEGEKCWQLVFVNHYQDIAQLPIENYENWEEEYKSDRWAWGFWSTWS